METNHPNHSDDLDFFSMIIEDVFEIKDRGVGVTGTVISGSLEPGEQVFLEGAEFKCLGVETFGGRRSAGDRIGVLLGHVDLDTSIVGSNLTKDSCGEQQTH